MKPKTLKPINSVGVVADLHCGSRFGLTPPSYWTSQTLQATKWLWECWVWLCKNWPRLDLLVLNGDLIDGKQPRSAYTGVITTSLAEQAEMAIECLEPLAKRALRIIRTQGTSYHESFDGPLSVLDEHFHIAKRYDDYTKFIVRDIRLSNEAVLNVKHQPEGEAMLYRGTGLDRELLWATVSESCKHLPAATHLIRSHLHSDAHMRGFGKEINFTPCFCLQAPYALHKKRYRWIPDIGATLIHTDKLGFKGYRVVSKTFSLPSRGPENYNEI